MIAPTRARTLAALTFTLAFMAGGALLASTIRPANQPPATRPSATVKPTPSFSDEKTMENEETAGEPATFGHLTVTIDGVRSNKGKIIIAIFDDATAFDTQDYTQIVDYAEIKAVTGRTSHDFQLRKAGLLAISLYHDENSNGSFDLSGEVPDEGYGTSGMESPYETPTFQNAQFSAGGTAKTHINIEMHYLNGL